MINFTISMSLNKLLKFIALTIILSIISGVFLHNWLFAIAIVDKALFFVAVMLIVGKREKQNVN